MVNEAKLKVKIFRLVDAQDGETLEEVYKLLLERLQATSQWAAEEEQETEEETRHFYVQTDALHFWEDEREDLYQDYLEKVQL